MPEYKLKPCPFCGGEAYYLRPREAGVFEIWSVECKECGAQPWGIQVYRGETTEHKREAIRHLWNRRADVNHKQ